MENSPADPLFKDFPPVSAETWKERISTELKGADYEQKLVWLSEDGIRVNPFYMKEDLKGLWYLESLSALKSSSGAPNGWIICQQIPEDPDPVERNHSIRDALKGGAQAVRIPCAGTVQKGSAFLDSLLKGIRLTESEVHFHDCLEADALYGSLIESLGNSGEEPAMVKGCLGADPLGKMVTSGYPLVITENLGNLVRSGKEQTPGFRIIGVDGTLIHNAGSTLVQELAFSLSMASDYLSVLTDQGLDPAGVVRSMQLNLASGPDYFLEIAKLRAARILWASMCEGYGLSDEQGRIRIHSVTSQLNMTLYDPHVNMLRATTGSMASVLGGADIVTVLPFDHLHSMNRAFSDRIARNVQIILRDEAYLERVLDPASGSYYIENLTDSIAEMAWELFKKTESEGGFTEAFRKGLVQEQVLKSRENKRKAAATGRMRLLGTNAFPNPKEVLFQEKDQKDKRAVDLPEESGLPPLPPLKSFRLASEFEELRQETESAGKRPKVFLFRFGDQAMSSARAVFSSNFFACAGYEIEDPPAMDSLKESIKRALASKPDIVVLCSSDERYPDMAEPVGKALGSKAVLVVAGQPDNMKGILEKEGINHFIHMNLNLLESLREFNRIMFNS